MDTTFIKLVNELTESFIEASLLKFEITFNDKINLNYLMSIILSSHMSSMIKLMQGFSETNETQKTTDKFIDELKKFLEHNGAFQTSIQTFQAEQVAH